MFGQQFQSDCISFHAMSIKQIFLIRILNFYVVEAEKDSVVQNTKQPWKTNGYINLTVVRNVMQKKFKKETVLGS